MNRAEEAGITFPRLYSPPSPPVRRWRDLAGPLAMLTAIGLLAAYAALLFWR